MALGFDFNQFMGNPMVQMGLGMLAQPRSWDNRGLGGAARGALQGLGNWQQINQFQQQQQLQQMQMEDLKEKREAAARKMKILQDAAEAYKGRVAKPRPLAFTPQPGDMEQRKAYDDAQVVGNMLAAGVDPTDIANFNKIMNPKAAEEGFTLPPGAQRYQGGKLVASNPLREKDATGPVANLAQALDAAERYRGTSTGKFYENLANKLSSREPAVQVNMNPLGSFQTIIGPDGKPQIVGVQVGRSGESQITPIGTPAPHTQGQQLPVSVSGKLFENRANVRRAKMALDLLEGKDVGDLKGDPEATGLKGFVPEVVLQRLDPKGVPTRAAVADLGSLVIHERSGAAVTAKEFPRLRPFIPHERDKPSVAKEKTKRFIQEYEAIVNDIESFYTDMGYSLPNAKQPSTGALTPEQQKRLDFLRNKHGRPAQ